MKMSALEYHSKSLYKTRKLNSSYKLQADRNKCQNGQPITRLATRHVTTRRVRRINKRWGLRYS